MKQQQHAFQNTVAADLASGNPELQSSSLLAVIALMSAGRDVTAYVSVMCQCIVGNSSVPLDLRIKAYDIINASILSDADSQMLVQGILADLQLEPSPANEHVQASALAAMQRLPTHRLIAFVGDSKVAEVIRGHLRSGQPLARAAGAQSVATVMSFDTMMKLLAENKDLKDMFFNFVQNLSSMLLDPEPELTLGGARALTSLLGTMSLKVRKSVLTARRSKESSNYSKGLVLALSICEDAVVTVDGISANVGPQQQVLEGLRGIVRAGMRVVGALNAVWGEWCASTEEDFRTPHPGAKSNGAKSQTRRGLLALPLSSAPSSASAHWLPPPVSLTPQVRDLFAHVIDEILHVLEDTLRTRIAPSAFLLVGERDTGRGDAAPKGAIGGGMMEAPTGIHINAGFLPRSNVVLLRTAIDEVMRCAASLGKHACLLHVPVEFKANAYLKAVSEACASSIVRYVYSVLEAGGGKSGGPGDHDGDHELRERERADACVDEFILLMACQMLESMKTTLLPGIITAHSSVLQLGDATASENSDAFKSCCAHLEDGQEALLKRWVEIKLQKLEPTMDVLLNHGLGSSSLSSGTEGKPSPAVRELMIILNAYDADISLTMPSLRDEVMGDIFLAVVDGWGNLVASEGASATRQARVDAESLKAWMIARLGSDDSEFETLLDGVTEAIEAIEAIETDLSHEDTQAALPEGNERKLSC